MARESRMATPWVTPQLLKVMHQTGPKRVEVNVAGQLQQVGLVLADNRFVTVLEQVTESPIAVVEVHNISGEQLPHALRKRLASGSDKQMEVRGKKSPGVDAQRAATPQVGDPVQEVRPISVGAEDRGPLDPSADHMMERPGRIESRVTWHAGIVW
jgi:hypothetical protein